MAEPFTREDARARATMADNTAETWRGVVTERAPFVERYTGDDKIAAERCLELAREQVAFHRRQAEAYRRISRGDEPYARISSASSTSGGRP